MNKEEIERLYDELGWYNIDDLYNYSCLLTSGFDKEQAFEFKGLLNELWLKDENDTSISKLSDMFYNIYEEIEDKIDNMGTREILVKMYENEY